MKPEHFSREFNLEAVRLLECGDKSGAALACGLKWSMQHLSSNGRKEDVADKEHTDEGLV